MSGLRWKLRRLRAMEASEVLRRAVSSARERLAPPAYAAWKPQVAFARLFEGRGPEVLGRARWAQRFHFAPDSLAMLSDTVEAARGLERGEWTLFGTRVSLSNPPDWSRDPLTGGGWPHAPSRAIDHRRVDLAGGVKGCWELGRGTCLMTLALASRVTGDRALADRALAWLEDFVDRNPLGHGVHHTSGIEMAIRTITHGATLALVGEHAVEARLEAALGLIAQQALHCRDHRSLGSSANNHLIAEYTAMTVTGAAFPKLRGAARLLRDGHRGLVHETLRQIHEDGVPAEQAFGYLPFVWELLLMGFLFADAAGHETPHAIRERLAASLRFARTVRLADGALPTIGDDDDGRILLADEHATRADLVGSALAAWLDDASPTDGAPALARLLIGRSTRSAGVADGRHEFPHGGYTVWRHDGLVVTFDHGPLGLGRLAAHGHADALAISVTHGADRVIVDPGTLAYQEDPAARDRCRSTPVHATVHFDGRDQSEMLGPFLWGRRATVTGDECRWFSGETHRRELAVDPGRVRWTDQVRGRNAQLALPLGPGAEISQADGRITVRVGRTLARIEAEGLAPWRIEASEFAPLYRRRVPTQRLTAAFEGERASVSITLESL